MNAQIVQCTCDDLKCPFHPSKHDKGCNLCIIKNLKHREIPSCFFNLVDKNADVEGYTFEDFAKLVLNNK